MSVPISVPRSDEDWEQVIALLKRVYVGDGYSTAERAEAFMLRSNFEPGGAMLVAHDQDHRVIGAVLHLHEQSPLKQIALHGEAEVRVLAVAPEARGQGVGEALVGACEERARKSGANALVLWSQPTMRAAHRLYERSGFVRVPERDQEDPRGFVRMVFRKVL